MLFRSDDAVELLDQLLALLLGHVGLAAQLLPELLRSLDFVGKGLRGFAVLRNLLLLGVGFPRCLRCKVLEGVRGGCGELTYGSRAHSSGRIHLRQHIPWPHFREDST